MLATRLEGILANEVRKLSLSAREPGDLLQRFESLRGSGLLPRGRAKNHQHLSYPEIVAAILSVTTAKPGFAGIVSKALLDLRPVGGSASSFTQCATFGQAVRAILEDESALGTLVEVRVSDSEIYTNGHCRAAIQYASESSAKTAYYVGQTASSLLRAGAEKTFDSRQLISTVVTETIFYPSFFRRLRRGLEKEGFGQVTLSTNGDEDDEELRKKERARSLEITPSSQFLNLVVDNQVTWPKSETAVSFCGYKLVLLPKTRDTTTSIHIDLQGQGISSEDARTLINRFLSLLTWCNDQFAILQDGFSGSSMPASMERRDLAFSTAHQWVFDRKIPVQLEAQRAIAIYRDGRNAEQNFLVSYATLCYYKIIELKHKGRGDAKNWFRDNYELLKRDGNLANRVADFDKIRGQQNPQDYLYDACRTAVAHANKPYSIDPDKAQEIRRLHIAASILRALARLFIRQELGVSDCVFDGT
jgi:hypothetical protein